MPNAILTPTAVTREALRILHQKANFLGSINRQYDDSYANSGAKIGDTLKIRYPNEFTIRSGATLAAQDTVETSVSLQIATQKGVDVNFTSAELTLSLDDFSKRILDPAMSVLVANVEYDVMTNVYKAVYNSIWNGGAAFTYNKFLDGRVLLQKSLTPLADRTANVNPQDMVDLIKDTKTLFNDQNQVAKQYKEGYMGRAAGFDFLENTLWPAVTRGDAASYVCNTSTGITSGSNTVTVTGGTGTLKAGDVFTIAGVFSIHPETKQPTTTLMQFTALADSTGTVTVSPTPYTTGGKQNISISAPGASKAVTMFGTASTTTGMSMAYHSDAFAFATADLQMPKGVDFSAREQQDGVSLRIVRAYDINNDKFPCRIDILYGSVCLRPQLAVRYHNN